MGIRVQWARAINAAGGAGLSAHKQRDTTAFIAPSQNGRQMKQVVGRVHRAGGGFSRQYFCGLTGTPQQDILVANREKIRRIDILNDADLDNLKFL